MSASTPAERRTQAMSLPPLAEADDTAITQFLDAIWAENGLAQQTLDSYRRDLEGLARWRDGRGIAGADRGALFDYLSWRTREGYSPRSNARLLSALRAFTPSACAAANAATIRPRCWRRRSCRARCPRRWPKARSTRC